MNRLVDKLRFIHLSDIHFRYRVGGDLWDLDLDLRNELELDVQRVVNEAGRADGILVTGDVAFSGAEKEYALAAEWLEKLTSLAGCRVSDVWMVPGNHDVDRRLVAGSRTIQDFHARMRSCPAHEIDDLLYQYLVSDKSGGEAYVSPLDNYVAFATRYECAVTAQRPWWDSSLPIGSSSVTLRMRGLSSPLISDERDDRDAHRMVLGTVQGNILREPRSIVMTLSHHPISWMRDGEAIDETLRTKARIQLWGHRHTHQARVLDGNLHLFAGAVHPQRGELDWEPRYNVFTLEVTDDQTHATVRLDSRVWSREDGAFVPDYDGDGERYLLHQILIEPLPEAGEGEEEAAALPEPEVQAHRDARRALAFEFSSLPFQRRLSVARELDLIDAETRGIADQVLFEVVLSRAVRGNQLAALWAAVQRERGHATDPNPFLEGSSGEADGD